MSKAIVSSRETDVAVVGYGGAGATAAITAADLGAKVLIVEKAAAGRRQHAGFPPARCAPSARWSAPWSTSPSCAAAPPTRRSSRPWCAKATRTSRGSAPSAAKWPSTRSRPRSRQLSRLSHRRRLARAARRGRRRTQAPGQGRDHRQRPRPVGAAAPERRRALHPGAVRVPRRAAACGTATARSPGSRRAAAARRSPSTRARR